MLVTSIVFKYFFRESMVLNIAISVFIVVGVEKYKISLKKTVAFI